MAPKAATTETEKILVRRLKHIGIAAYIVERRDAIYMTLPATFWDLGKSQQKKALEKAARVQFRLETKSFQKEFVQKVCRHEGGLAAEGIDDFRCGDEGGRVQMASQRKRLTTLVVGMRAAVMKRTWTLVKWTWTFIKKRTRTLVK
jgi:hypothetical protein